MSVTPQYRRLTAQLQAFELKILVTKVAEPLASRTGSARFDTLPGIHPGNQGIGASDILGGSP